MRHRVAGVKLSRTAAHRRALFRNLVTALLEHKAIRTTDAKAKEIRRWADRMITLGKQGTLHARRRAATVLRRASIAKKLFDDIPPPHAQRNRGLPPRGEPRPPLRAAPPPSGRWVWWRQRGHAPDAPPRRNTPTAR